MRRRIVCMTLVGLASIIAGAREASAEERIAAPVRVRVHLQRAKDAADVLVERHGAWTLACRAPCTFDGVPGEQVRITMEGLIEEPLVFTVPAGGATEHDIEVRRRGDGLFVGGLVAFGAGAMSLALGMAIIRGAGKEDLFGEGNRAVASVAMVLGAASAVTGVVLVVRRSTTPFVAPKEPLPTTRAQALDELASTRAFGVGALRAPSAPPQVGFTLEF